MAEALTTQEQLVRLSLRLFFSLFPCVQPKTLSPLAGSVSGDFLGIYRDSVRCKASGVG